MAAYVAAAKPIKPIYGEPSPPVADGDSHSIPAPDGAQPQGTTAMSASFLKGIFGWLMAGSAGLVALLPPQYQWIATMLIGLFGGAHGVTSAVSGK
jgi:hypothetical protein